MNLCKKILKHYGSSPFAFTFLDCVNFVVLKNSEQILSALSMKSARVKTTCLPAFISSPFINLVSQVLLKSVTHQLLQVQGSSTEVLDLIKGFYNVSVFIEDFQMSWFLYKGVRVGLYRCISLLQKW